jgi:hypothetical protein
MTPRERPGTRATVAPVGAGPAGGGGGAPAPTPPLPPDLVDRSCWSDGDLDAARVPVEVVRLVTIGGGLASFSLVDQLRIRGVPASAMATVTDLVEPHHRFRQYARNSQLADTDRLRSDSATRIDNPWGFPAYALEEAVRLRRITPVVRTLVEPVLVAHHTPTTGQVYRGVEREADRIGWAAMRRPGSAVAVRRRVGGGFFVAYRRSDDGGIAVLRADSVHLGTGHAGLRRSGAAETYRRASGDLVRVVHAYETHEHVYRSLADLAGGTVVVQGAGITASQVFARIADDRRRLGLATRVVQVTRDRPPTDLERRRPRRPFHDGMAVQPFSAPRAAFGGELQRRRERADPEQLRVIEELVARPTTAPRRSWAKELGRATADGWYRHVPGEVVDIDDGGGGLSVTWEEPDGSGSTVADFVVDCTGFLDPPVLPDLAAGVLGDDRPATGVAVDPAFAVVGTRDPTHGGAVYISGAAAGDGPIGPRNSFWGMQEAAFRIADDLAAAGLSRRNRGARSVRAWLRWVRNRPA